MPEQSARETGGGAPDARRDRLCAPVRGIFGEKTFIDCRLETGSFAPRDGPVPAELVVVAYNVERGLHAGAQVEQLASGGDVPAPDVLLLTEVDRGCSRTGYRNVAREYAQRLGMDYVFGVEFVELPRCLGRGRRIAAPCEHGNAVLSRYPLADPRLIRFAHNRSWHSWPQRLLRLGEPRLGGRMALAADVRLGAGTLTVYCTHLESGRTNERLRGAQARELAEDGLRRPGPVIVAGDFNSGAYLADLRAGTRHDAAVRELTVRGYADAHAGLAPEARRTTRSGVVIDLIFGRGVQFTDAGIGLAARWDALSDHRPVWARVRL
jgi:endonuclease/exonuclease/phosphatase family metal-dependent hydrolase